MAFVGTQLNIAALEVGVVEYHSDSPGGGENTVRGDGHNDSAVAVSVSRFFSIDRFLGP